MAFSSWSPGLIFIFQSIPKLLLPLSPVLFAHYFVSDILPYYIWILAYTVTLPLTAVFKVLSCRLREDREIKVLGVRRAPQVYSRLPGGISLILDALRSFNEGYIGDSFAEIGKEYGPTFNLRAFWNDMIVTSEPDHVKALLATEFDNFEKGDKFHWFMQSVLGTGVFNSDGDMWRFHRGITRPFFARDRVTDFELFDRHAENIITQLKERFAEGEAVDFQDAMGRFTLDSATEFLFGSCVHSLSAHLPYAHSSPRYTTTPRTHSSDTFLAAFSQAQHQIGLRARLSVSWALAEIWGDKTKDSMKVIHDYVGPILNDALTKKTSDKKTAFDGNENGGASTLLDHLITQTDDESILRDEILNIMIAGRDTTMSTLTSAIYCLSQHPAVLAKLRQEILAHVGSNRRPTFEDVKDCRYLRAVLNETLRLYPPVPFNVRHSIKSTTWPAPDGGKPLYIPADVDVSYSVWIMHRREDLWGPDAMEFDPDRFLDHRLHKYLTPNPFIFLPFNAGPRICLGQQFAYNEASFMLIRLLQSFDTISLAPDAQPPDSLPPASWKLASGRQAKEKIRPKVHITTYIHKGLWLRMGEAQYKDEV